MSAFPSASTARSVSGWADLREFEPSPEEPSVWTPRSPDLLELNFVGVDPAQDPSEAYILEDDRLPLLVFGALSLLARGAEVEIGGTRLALPTASSWSHRESFSSSRRIAWRRFPPRARSRCA
jgi:hypothetical protein